MSIHGPTSHTYFSQRMRLHYVDWGNHGAPPLLLVHGTRDHCRNWDRVAEAFRDQYHIIAPDLRGHGDSQWNSGGTYMLPDYAADIAQLVRQSCDQPVTIIGHSLGGMISLQYTGLFPDTVKKVVAIEGLGQSPKLLAEAAATPTHKRYNDWIDGMRKMAGKSHRPYDTLDDALARMRDANPHLSEDQARHLTIHGVNRNEDGTYVWKFDPYLRLFAPFGFSPEQMRDLWQQITCPVLLFRGEESWASDPLKDGRAEFFNDARVHSVADAGHWVHHDQLDVFLDKTRAFLDE